MSNLHKHIANESWEEAGALTSRCVNKSGLSAGAKRMKKYYNRIGKRGDAKFAFSTQDV